MAEPLYAVSAVISSIQSLVAITSLLRQRYKKSPTAVNELEEGRRTAQEIEVLLNSNSFKEPSEELKDLFGSLRSEVPDLRESFSSAKTQKELQRAVKRLSKINEQLITQLGAVQQPEQYPSFHDTSERRKSDTFVPLWLQIRESSVRLHTRAMLDTGSSVSYISRNLLESLSARPLSFVATTFGSRISRLFPYLKFRYPWGGYDRIDSTSVKLWVFLDALETLGQRCLFVIDSAACFPEDLLLGRDYLEQLVNRPIHKQLTQSTPSQGLLSIHDLKHAEAHIIFVHSPFGGARTTWQGRSDTFWPKEFLAQDLKNCSISMYDYDAGQRPVRTRKSFEETMEDLANSLLELVDEETSRPILWICHSLGGHIVKSALTRSRKQQQRPSTGPPRLSSTITKGAIFLGTPHRTSTSLGVSENIMALSYKFDGRSREEENPIPHKFDNTIAYTTSAFSTLMDREGFPIVSLFENKPSLTRQGPRRIVSQITRMHHPDEGCGEVEGDHLSMCRFETREERGYQTVLTSIQNLLGGRSSGNTWDNVDVDMQSRTRSMQSSVSDIEIVDIDKIYMNLRLKIDLPTARWQSPNSGESFDSSWIEEQIAQSWPPNRRTRPLLISGPVGSGKSKLAESMQQWLGVPDEEATTKHTQWRPCRLQLFFKSDQRTQQTPITMLEFLIAQILDQNPTLVYHIRRKSFSRHIPVMMAHSLLQRTLCLLLEDTCWSSIYLMVDALDECSSKYVVTIIDILDHLLQIPKVRAVMTISITPEAGLEKWSTEPNRSLIDSFTSKNKFVEIRLPQIAGWSTMIGHHIEKRLVDFGRQTNIPPQHCDRIREVIRTLPMLSFFVIDLALQHLQRVLSGGIWKQDQQFEAELDQLKGRAVIDSLLIDVATVRPRQCHWVLSMIAAAKEPLRLLELTTIFLRDTDIDWQDAPKEPDYTASELQRLIDDDLHRLLRIDGDGIHLGSESIRQVVHSRMAGAETTDLDAIRTESAWIDPTQLHLRLSTICLRILLEGVKLDRQDGQNSKRAPLVLEVYASRHWQNHLREASESPAEVNELVVQWIRAHEESRHGEVKGPADLSPVLLKRLTENNLSTTMGAIFDDSSFAIELPDANDIDRVLEKSLATSTPETLNVLRAMIERRFASDSTAKTFLIMAEGNELALEELMRSFTNTERAKFLRKAIELQKENLVRIILNSYSEEHRIPKIQEDKDEIAYAVQYQSQRIVKQMLSRKELFDLDFALLKAVDAMNFEMSRELLIHGAKVCLFASELGWLTPLHVAAQRGHRDLVDLMLDWSAPINIRDRKGGTPLHHAAKCGRVDIIRRLVKGSASVTDVDNNGSTALFSACGYGQIESAKLLWSLGSSISHTDNDGRSMLHAAAKYGHEEIVKMLLEARLSAQGSDNNGLAPIHEACRSGWAPIVDKLLQAGAPVNAADNTNRTCLHYACQGENVPESVVQLLLDMGADPSARARPDGCTPLMLATQYSTVRVLKMFWRLDKRLFKDTDQKGRTVLDYLRRTGDAKTAVHFPEKEDFLAHYYSSKDLTKG